MDKSFKNEELESNIFGANLTKTVELLVSTKQYQNLYKIIKLIFNPQIDGNTNTSKFSNHLKDIQILLLENVPGIDMKMSNQV